MFSVSKMWVQDFYNVKQKYPNHIKRLPAVLKDIGKIVILQNIVITEIALIFHLLENVVFLHDSAHHSEVWQANSFNPYLIFLLIVSGEKKFRKKQNRSYSETTAVSAVTQVVHPNHTEDSLQQKEMMNKMVYHSKCCYLE